METCTAEVAHKGDLTEPVTLTTALRFYTRSGSEVKFEYTTLEEESVDVTLQVYKVATLPVEDVYKRQELQCVLVMVMMFTVWWKAAN